MEISSVIKILSREITLTKPVQIRELLKEAGINYRGYVAGIIDDKIVDLNFTIVPDGQSHTIQLIESSDKNKSALEILRHSAAHITAQAVLRLYKGAKLGIGPPIENGFYYDIEFPENIGEDALAQIEKEIQKIVQENLPIERFELPKNEAIQLCKKLGQDYKVMLLEEDIKNHTVSFYRQGEFTDLCEGPHVPETGYLKNIKLERITGAYWKGDEKNKMLQRIYGTVFFTKEALEEYLKMVEEQKKRDHRVLNKSLKLFSIEEDAGAGFIFWHPNGAIIRLILEDLWRKLHLKNNYKFAYTPHIASSRLYEISGHLQYYRDNMFPFIELENVNMQLKPMNCPGHILIYRAQTRSYKELPFKLCELGTVYRYEKHGVVGGLFRVRGLTIDDAHIFCEPSQIEQQVLEILNLTRNFLSLFGFNDYKIYLSTRPENSIGEKALWDLAENSLKNALEKANLQYETAEGAGAFYGPKIDLNIKDALNRYWQCSTIQVDFNLPIRFQLKYAGRDNIEHTPVIIHRAVMGSIERFMGILIEHFAGIFPLWLSPVQIAILPISENHLNYAEIIYNKLTQNDIRVEKIFDKKNISSRIRECIIRKIPYMMIIGEAEVKQQKISLRSLKEGHIGSFTIDELLTKIQPELLVPYNI